MQVIRKTGNEVFWIVQGSSVSRCGNVQVSDEAELVMDNRNESTPRPLLEALTSTANSTIRGKVLQVGNLMSFITYYCIIFLFYSKAHLLSYRAIQKFQIKISIISITITTLQKLFISGQSNKNFAL